jgi:hypothetical protein
MNVDFEESFRRIDAIIGDEDDPGKATEVWFHHLRANLALPCDVTGVEDFRWEEPYVLGVGDAREYRRLCRQQPSYRDVFTLESIEAAAADSEWSLHHDDLGARVIRKSDSRPFLLGLSELRAVDHEQNAQLLQDYSVWLVNYR